MRPIIITDVKPQPVSTHGKFINIFNKTFGRLTVIAYAGDFSWYCLCNCGNKIIAKSGHLRTGDTVSCGCFQSENFSRINGTHHEAHKNTTPEYAAYSRAKGRCNNRNNKYFRYYGGRGIEFRFDSYENFLKEVGRRPTGDYSLDRINTNGHYEAGNLRWATKDQQINNRTNTTWITIDNVTKTRSEWAEIYKTTIKQIDKRVRRRWCVKCAVTVPMYGKCVHKSTAVIGG